MMIKVCGMRDANNISEVELLGIDMMGFIFYHKSSRYVDYVPEYLPIGCQRIGVFVNPNIDDIASKVNDYALDGIQLHGSEPPELIEQIRKAMPHLKVIKAIQVASASDLNKCCQYEGLIDYFLFETKCCSYGGSGKKFDWSLLDGYNGNTPFLLTGGIGPDDVEVVKGYSHPRFCGIDLNSRFEISPAIKDVDALRQFIKNI